MMEQNSSNSNNNNNNNNNNNQILREVVLTTKLLRAKEEQERSQYIIQWKDTAHTPPQLKTHEGPETGGALIILMGIQDILESCPKDQPILITLKHKRIVKLLKNGCRNIEASPKHLKFLNPHIAKLRLMILSRRGPVYTKRLGKNTVHRVLGSGRKNQPATTYVQPSVNIGSSSSSVRPAPVMSQQEIEQVQLQNQQIGAPPVATSSRISAFTPVLSSHIPHVFTIPAPPIRSQDQLVRSSYEQMAPEHRVYSALSEGQISESYSTIIKEPRQQDTQPTRRSARLRAQHEKFGEGGKRGIQLQELKATIQNRQQGVISSSSLPELQSAGTYTQQMLQQTSGPSSFASPSSSLADLVMPPHGVNIHVNITREQQREMLMKEKLKRERKKLLRRAERLQQQTSPARTETYDDGMGNLLTVRYGGDTFRCNLTFKEELKLLRIQQKREKAYKTSLVKRQEYLEVNRWLDNMKEDNPLKVRATYNAYNNIPPENVFSEEENKAIGFDHINQQKQGEGQSSYGIFGRILKGFGF